MSFKPIYKLREHIDKNTINWYGLFGNFVAINLREKNQDKIKLTFLSENPAVFALDKEAMRKQIDNGFAEELISTVLHPRHLMRNLELYNYNITTDEYESNY